MLTAWRWVGSTILVLYLLGCASGANTPAVQGRDIFPSGTTMYSWGWSQKAEDFANVEHAQSGLRLDRDARRMWTRIPVEKSAFPSIGALGGYYPMYVRWKLKDGREFILEDIDLRSIMREYFKTNELILPWQRERRPRVLLSDPDPILAHEVKDDTVRIKWVVRINTTPVNQRIGPGGAANPWKFSQEEHLVTTIKGVPTSRIDFTTLNDYFKK